MKPLHKVIIGVIALVAVFLNCVNSAPLNRHKAQAAIFFEKYGYIKNSKDSAGSLDFRKAIADLQKFGGLSATGELNKETMKLINTKRCGLKDPVEKLGRAQIGNFYLQGTYWKKKDLTYRFERGKSTRDLPVDVQQNIIQRMINKWDKASSLTIRKADPSLPDDKVDIRISFVTRRHGDPYPFDGQGGTLAHAFYPHDNLGLSGDAHFDDAEKFTTGTKEGINLDWVALHEVGHSLGLQHSNVRESVMYPWYKGYQGSNIELTNDDLLGIRALYGAEKPVTKKSSPAPPTTPSTKPLPTDRPTPPAIHPACKPGSKYDAVVMEGDQTHFFQGHKFWTLDGRLQKGEPKRVTDYWPSVRTPIDAAYRNRRGYIVFFTGNWYWEYNNRKQLVSSSSLEAYGLLGNLSGMDAVFTWNKNKKTYFFKGKEYWRYDERRKELDSGYPKMITIGWPDLASPLQIHAAVTWKNKRSYVFSGKKYLRLQNKARGRKVFKDPGYPRETADAWMKCNAGLTGSLNLNDPET